MSNESIGWWHTPLPRLQDGTTAIRSTTMTVEQIRLMIREEIRNALQEYDEQPEPNIVTITQESDEA